MLAGSLAGKYLPFNMRIWILNLAYIMPAKFHQLEEDMTIIIYNNDKAHSRRYSSGTLCLLVLSVDCYSNCFLVYITFTEVDISSVDRYKNTNSKTRTTRCHS